MTSATVFVQIASRDMYLIEFLLIRQISSFQLQNFQPFSDSTSHGRPLLSWGNSRTRR